MRALIKTKSRDIEEVLALRRHIAELEGLEATTGLVIRLPVASKSGRRSSIQKVNEGVFISTRQGSLIDGNQAFLEMVGYIIEELFGLNIMDICLNPIDGAKFLKALDEKGYVIDYKIKLRRKDGSEFGCMFTSTIRWYNDDNIPDNQPLFKTWVRPAK